MAALSSFHLTLTDVRVCVVTVTVGMPGTVTKSVELFQYEISLCGEMNDKKR